MTRKSLLLASAASAAATAFALPAAAQELAEAEAQPRAIETITVTAQRREQSVQDVPAVVTAVSAQLMQDAGVRDIKDLQILTPGMTVTSTSNETITTARIRGIGTVGDNPGLESSVGVLIDGVYRPRNGVSFGDLGELERVEVLKGPQGTLFGKNTSAGVINILTAQPQFEFGANAEVTVGNFGQRGASASITGPFSDTVAGRFYVAARERDGFLDVVETGPGPRTIDEDVDQSFYTLRGQLLIAPSDDLDIRIIADYTERDENCCLGTQLFIGQGPDSRARLINNVRPGSIPLEARPFDRQAYANRDTTQSIVDTGISAEVNWTLTPDVALTSITAWRDWDTYTGQNSDFTAADLIWRPADGTNNLQIGQFSQELRLAGERGMLDWIVGGFYASETIDARSRLLFGEDYYPYLAGQLLQNAPSLIGLFPGTVLQPGNGSDDTYSQDGETFAVFADGSFAITDRFNLSVGGRYTWDEKSLTSTYTSTGATCDQAEEAFIPLAQAAGQAAATQIVGTLCLNGQNQDFDRLGTLSQSQTENEFSGSVRASYDLTDQVMLYATYARGYKSGGFNMDRSSFVEVTPTGPNFRANPDTSFAPETVNAFEAGFKSTLAGGSLFFNVGAFHQEYSDFQLNTFVGTAFIVETIPEVTSTGVEMDFTWRSPVDGLSFQGGLTYAYTQCGYFVAEDLSVPGRFNALRRLPGERMPFAPLWSGSLAATYEQAISPTLEFRGNIAAKFLTEYNTGSDLHPSKVQDGYALLNARAGIGSQDGRWTVELWGQNITDQDYLQVGFNGPFQVNDDNDEVNERVSVYNAFLGAPRTWGVTLRVAY
jgi:iron complex outermembrane recepter protein